MPLHSNIQLVVVGTKGTVTRPELARAAVQNADKTPLLV